MGREFYLELAAKNLAVPLAVDLLVHTLSDAEKVESDPDEMARVMIGAAEKFEVDRKSVV